MAFTWFDKLTNVLDKVPENLQADFVLGVVNYGAKDIEPTFEFPLDAVFEGIREDIDNSKKARTNNKGGRPKNQEKEQKTGGSETEKTPVSKTSKQGVSKTKKPPVSETENPPFREQKTGGSETEKTPPYIYQTKPNQTNTGQDKEPPYPLSCLKILNEIMGTSYTRNPHGEFLADFESSVPLEDVRRMVEFKRDEWWGTRFQHNLTPSTLFSPDHFETYIAQSKMPKPTKTTNEVIDDELSVYDL